MGRSVRVLVVAMAAILTLTIAPATAGAASCAAIDYQAGLTAAAAALRAAPADVAAARREVTALLSAGPDSRVALQPVVSDLSMTPPGVDDALLRLSSMSATLAYPHGSVCNENADAARSALRGVYASPDFSHLDETSQPGLLTTIVNAITSLLSRGAGALGPVGAVLLGAVVLAVALALVWRRWRGGAALRVAGIEEPAALGDDPEAEWRMAARAAAAGEYREAVRRAFRSALLDVAIAGQVRIDAAWTTRELLQRIDAGGDILIALAAAASVFERAWYSGTAVTPEDWAVAEERCATVRRLARNAAVPAR